jgi:hypothetical protein
MDEDYDFDMEPDLDFGFEFDSAMASAGLGTDEDYGFYGDPDEYWSGGAVDHDLIGGDSDLLGEW